MNDADIIRGLAQEMLEWKAQTVRLIAEVKRLQAAVSEKDGELKKLVALHETCEQDLDGKSCAIKTEPAP